MAWQQRPSRTWAAGVDEGDELVVPARRLRFFHSSPQVPHLRARRNFFTQLDDDEPILFSRRKSLAAILTPTIFRAAARGL